MESREGWTRDEMEGAQPVPMPEVEDKVPSPEIKVRISGVRVGDDYVQIRLSDGRRVSIPLERLPGLSEATLAEREGCLLENGVAVEWEGLGLRLTVHSLLDGTFSR